MLRSTGTSGARNATLPCRRISSPDPLGRNTNHAIPEPLFSQIARNELAASDLTHPHLVSISEAFASLEGDVRRRLPATSAARPGSCRPSSSPAQWSGNSARRRATPSSTALPGWPGTMTLASPGRAVEPPHAQFPPAVLFAGTPPPGEIPAAQLHGFCLVPGEHARSRVPAEWFKKIGGGKSPRQLDLPVTLHQANGRIIPAGPGRLHGRGRLPAGRRSSVLAAMSVWPRRSSDQELAADFSHEEFWTLRDSRWLIASPMSGHRSGWSHRGLHSPPEVRAPAGSHDSR